MKARLAILVLRLLGWLPLRAARRLGRFLGGLAYRWAPRGAITTRQNINVAFPELSDAEREQLTRQSYLETWALLFEGGAIWTWDPDRLESHIESFNGVEAFEQASRSDAPVVVLLPHLGNWELLAQIFGRRLDIVALYEMPSDEGMDALIKHSRERLGMTLAPMTVSGLRLVRRTLEDNGTVALLPDQVPGRRSGMHANFFGLPALTMTLAHRLISEQGARCFLASCTRTERGFDITLSEAPDAVADPDAMTSLVAMNSAIESLVRATPTQYQWEYKRFKHLPPDYPPVYPKAAYREHKRQRNR